MCQRVLSTQLDAGNLPMQLGGVVAGAAVVLTPWLISLQAVLVGGPALPEAVQGGQPESALQAFLQVSALLQGESLSWHVAARRAGMAP